MEPFVVLIFWKHPLYVACQNYNAVFEFVKVIHKIPSLFIYNTDFFRTRCKYCRKCEIEIILTSFHIFYLLYFFTIVNHWSVFV